jgi:predicted dehydrogenase
VSEPIDVAVVGVGYLGRLHAEKYAAHPRARLRALVDPDPATREFARRLDAAWLPDWHDLPSDVRAVSVAVPTQLHHEVGCCLLRSGRDVLVEKPIAASLAEADALVAAAEAGGRVLQVGHLERFNPAIRRLAGFLREPRFIESHRLAPWNVRGTDVDVVLDLMIHDIDIILNVVRSEAVAIHAAGVPVISPSVDIANARIQFADGCVANITASRVSAQKMRKIRVFQSDAYVSIDFLQRSAAVVRRRVDAELGAVRGLASGAGAAAAMTGAPVSGYAGPGDGAVLATLSGADGGPGLAIVRQEISFEDDECDALALEIDAFLEAVESRSEPAVTGRDGRRALEVANRITEQIGLASATDGRAERR